MPNAAGLNHPQLPPDTAVQTEAAPSIKTSSNDVAFVMHLTRKEPDTLDPARPQRKDAAVEIAKAPLPAVPELISVTLPQAAHAAPGFPSPLASPTPVAIDGMGREPAMRTVGDALRTSEIAAPAAPEQKQGPAQDLAVRIARPEAPPVDVHLTERAGQIHVAVRTPDVGLQVSLRQDLGTLVNSLDRTGYRVEAFTGASTEMNSQQNFQGRQESESASGGHCGSHERSGQQHEQQRQRNRAAQDWMEVMENAA